MPTSPPSHRSESDSKFKTQNLNIVILAGGVGGAKLVDGIAQLVPAENLTVVVNTGDDFQHMGLTICPDLDTVMYTVAGIANPETGWGRAGESWQTFDEVGRLGGPDWFRLGDLDLACHLIRSQLLTEGRSLTEVTRHLCQKLDVEIDILPMSDQPSPTHVATDQGLLSFQTWFVEQAWQPAVEKIHLAPDLKTTPHVAQALEKADLVILAPSNPFVSIDPILNAYPIREMIADLPRLVLAVSPIIAGQAVKGPAAKMMSELGLEVSSASVAAYYDGLLDVFVYDSADDVTIEQPDLVTFQTNTFMQTRDDRRHLAQEVLNFSVELLNS